jgi:hypothetical protein
LAQIVNNFSNFDKIKNNLIYAEIGEDTMIFYLGEYPKCEGPYNEAHH